MIITILIIEFRSFKNLNPVFFFLFFFFYNSFVMTKGTSSKKTVWKGIQMKANDVVNDRPTSITSQDSGQKVKKKKKGT